MSLQQYTRRDFVKAMGLGLAAFAVQGCTAVPGLRSDKHRQPNIVLMMSDDMGFSDIGCYGGEIDTPNLNALASGGVRFTQFYNTARCCPTRTALMTGLYPHQAGVGHMMEDKGHDAYRGDLNSSCVTIAQVLRQAGYRAYMTGKWHVTRFSAEEGPKHNWPCQRGFDKFYGTITGAGSFYDPTTLCRNNTYITPLNDPEYRSGRYYYTDAISDNAAKYIREHYKESPDKPFFMYVAYTAAHWPMHALEEDIEKYKGKYDGGYEPLRKDRFERLKRMGLISKDWDMSPQAGDWQACEHKDWEARCMEVYAAMIDRMDQGIGRIVAELKRQGVFENTLILFLQDNGGCAEGMGRAEDTNTKWVDEFQNPGPMGPNDLQPKVSPPMRARDGRPLRGGPTVMPGPADTYIGYGRDWANVSNTPFREYKHWVHEGGISTPLIAHWPERIKARGKLRHQPGHLIDIMATCVDVAQAKYPAQYEGRTTKPMEGRSLLPAFDNKPIEREAIYWEHEGNRAVRQGRWKLVSKHPGGWELYDMQTDRTELNDLAAKYPEKVQQLKTLYESWAARCDVQPWPIGSKPVQKKKKKA